MRTRSSRPAALSPTAANASSMRSGMVSTVGPVSMRYPPASRRPARPPGVASRSTTVTARPRPARCSAAASPARPAPTTTTSPDAPLTVRIASPGPVGRADGEVTQRRYHEVVEPGAGQAAAGGIHPGTDHLLDPADRAGVRDELAQPVKLGPAQVRPRVQPPELRVLAGARQLGGERDDAGRLVLAQVAAAWLASDRRRAEDAEQVIAQLERLADQRAVAAERVADAAVAAGERGAELKRAADGVVARLLAAGREHRLHWRQVPRVVDEVGELPDGELAAHPVVDRPAPGEHVGGQAALTQHLLRPHQQQVAEQDGGGLAEVPRVARQVPRRVPLSQAHVRR